MTDRSHKFMQNTQFTTKENKKSIEIEDYVCYKRLKVSNPLWKEREQGKFAISEFLFFSDDKLSLFYFTNF